MDLPVMSEIVFDVTREDIGGYAAECESENLSVMADSWEDLRNTVKAAVEKHFHQGPKPISIRLHLVRDEVLPLDLEGA
jgi:hypothetical protein